VARSGNPGAAKADFGHHQPFVPSRRPLFERLL
jgi:hypothetical protein